MSEPENTSMNPDPRTAEVLRALQRARGMVASGRPLISVPGASRTPETLPRASPANGGHASQEVLESLASSVRFLETALVTAGEKLSDPSRSASVGGSCSTRWRSNDGTESTAIDDV